MYVCSNSFELKINSVLKVLFAVMLLFITRQNRESPELALTGGRSFKLWLGWGTIITSTTGIFLEGIGGVLHIGDFFFQIAHETMYFGFLSVGIAAILEARGTLPKDTWRFAMGVSFFC